MKLNGEDSKKLSTIRRNLIASTEMIRSALDIEHVDIIDFEGVADELQSCVTALERFLKTCYTVDGKPRS